MLERGAGVMKEDCVHHWLIPTANGPTSLGVCGKCKMEKAFYNSVMSPEHHITLEKEHSDSDSKSTQSKWMEYWPHGGL